MPAPISVWGGGTAQAAGLAPFRHPRERANPVLSNLFVSWVPAFAEMTNSVRPHSPNPAVLCPTAAFDPKRTFVQTLNSSHELAPFRLVGPCCAEGCGPICGRTGRTRLPVCWPGAKFFDPKVTIACWSDQIFAHQKAFIERNRALRSDLRSR